MLKSGTFDSNDLVLVRRRDYAPWFIVVGDRVKLCSGGPVMVVESIEGKTAHTDYGPFLVITLDPVDLVLA